MQTNGQTLKVALQGELPQGQLSPENISTIALYHLHYNIWDTLLASGQRAAVAKSFLVSADGLTFFFEIDPDAKFSNGRPIRANEIKAAFERIIEREEGGHINAKSVIRKISAASPLDLKIELKAPTPSFLFLLTTPEFGIVPSEAIDANGNVVNLSVTSGAYAVKQFDAITQTAALTKNTFFRRSDPAAPSEVNISFIKDLGENTELSDFDFIEVRSSDAEIIVSNGKKKGFSHKATVPSVSVFLVADLKLLSEKQAKFIATFFRKNFQYETPNGLEKRSHQFFPEKTFGSLSHQEIFSISSKEDMPALPPEIVISNYRSTGPLIEAVKKIFSRIGTKVRFVALDSKEPVHYMLTGQGMNTEFPEIELHLDTVGPYADFNATDEIKQLVMLATHEPDDTARSKIIKMIGRDFLSSGKIIPLTVRSYVHLFPSSRLSLNGITNYDGDIPFFKLQVLK